MEIAAPRGARVSAVLDTPDLLRRPGAGSTAERPRAVTLGRRVLLGDPGGRRMRLRLRRAARQRLARRRAPLTARLLVVAALPDGRRLSAVRRVRVVS